MHMKINQFALVIGCFILSFTSLAQKKILGPEVYNDWKRIGDIQLSNDGKFAAYTIKPHRGDGFLFIVNIETGKKDSIARGVDPKFSASSEFVAFRITPIFDTLRKLELNKVSKDKWPKDNLGVWILANDSLIKYPDVKEWKIASKGNTIAFLSHKNDFPKNYLTKKEQKKLAKTEKKKGKIKTDGKLLSVVNPLAGTKVCYRNVSSFEVSNSGKYVVFQEHEKLKKDSVRLCIHQENGSKKAIWTDRQRKVAYSGFAFNSSENTLVLLHSQDTNTTKYWNLVQLNLVDFQWGNLVDSTTKFSNEHYLSSNFQPYFKNNDRDLFFGIGSKPEPNAKDSLLENEKVKMDLWHWKDDRMQPQQLVELRADQRKTVTCVYHFNTRTVTELGSDTLDLQLNRKVGETQTKILASSNEQYRYKTWESPSADDYYLIHTEDGKIELLQKEAYSRGYLSPSGNYYVFWNHTTKNYYVMNTQTGVESCVTCNYQGNLLDDINGMPMMAGPQGVVGFSPNDDGVIVEAEKALVYYQWATNRLTILTENLQKSAADTNYKYQWFNTQMDSSVFYPAYGVVTKFDKKSKAMEVYRVKGSFPLLTFELISGSNHDYVGFRQSKSNQRIVFQRQSNADYPDLFATMKPGDDIKQISKTNPQQSGFNWSTVELIHWTSYEGIPLEGLLYKPENFDPNQEYPLLVYFYELYSDEIHNHYAPKPTASIIFPTEYASAGYVVFIPDVRYKPGHPAESAYDCILSGTDAVLKMLPNIDPKRMGLQGQSWGGYQTAQLITMTDRFAAAMAGAPVGNMFSAYGGIRWGSGYSRQFQYEHTQSRIGKTMWDAPELFVENSPVFHLPKVKTPLMIMHNDEDGAVPWYQGIELYTGLRRLQKPVWLLNYNGDDHNLMKNANRIDLSIRMRQFFDYYLLGKDAPYWLIHGIPAIDKGKKMNYQLIEGQ